MTFATYPIPLATSPSTGLGDASSDPNASTGPSAAHTALVTAAPIVLLGGLGAALGFAHDKIVLGAGVGAAIGTVFAVYNYSLQHT